MSQIDLVAEKMTGLEQSLAIALGDRLRELRKKADLTQEELAERASMTRNHYQVLENGRTSHGASPNPTLKSIYNVAQALDTSVFDILDGVFPRK